LRAADRRAQAGPSVRPIREVRVSETQLRFHPLSFVPEGDEVLVGRPDIDSYAVLPVEGAALLERLTRGATPADAAGWYAETYGETVDMPDFLQTLDGLGFVQPTGPAPDAPQVEPADGTPVRFQRLGRAVFSPFAFVLYLLVVLWWLVVVSRHPELTPGPHQVFFTDSLLLVQVLIMFGQLPWLFAHESFHVLAGRRLGLRTSLGLGTRLYVILVFETRMNGLLTVPRRRRYLPFLAGMLLDVVAICGLGIIASFFETPGGGESLPGRIALAMAFPILTRFAYQFLLFLQTDVYFVIASALGCYDLHAATRAVVRNHLWRALRRPDRHLDVGQWSERDQRLARWYAPFFAVGVVVLVGLWLLALRPVLLGIVRLSVQGFQSPVHDAHFWDTTLFVALNVAQLAFYGLIYLRNLARYRRTRAADRSAAPAATLGWSQAS
jgi:hypothetical protein